MLYLLKLETGKTAAANVKTSILDAMNMVYAAGFNFPDKYESSYQNNKNEDWDVDFNDDDLQSIFDGLVSFNE